MLFGGLMDELLSEYRGRMTPRPHHPRAAVFPAIDELLKLFKRSCKELLDLRRQVRRVAPPFCQWR